MLLLIGLSLLFFLPFFEASEKGIGFFLLLMASASIGSTLIKKKIKFDSIEWIFILFLHTSIISSIFSLSVSRSLAETLRYLAYFIIFLSVRRLEIAKKELIKFFLIGSVMINSLILSLVSFSYLLPINIFPLPIGGMNLYHPTFGHNHLAGILIMAIPLVLYFSVEKKLMIPVLIFFILSLLLSYSRIAYILITIDFIIFIIFKIREIKMKLLFIFSGMIISVFLVFQFVFFNSFSEKNISFLPKQFHKSITIPEYRVDYIKQALSGWRLSPVLGTGLDTFRYISAKYKENNSLSSWFTHNHYIQLFSETGVLGGGLFILLLLFIFMKILRYQTFQVDPVNFSLFLGALGTMTNNLVDYDFQFLSIFMYFWIILAILLPIDNSKKISPLKNIVLIAMLSVLLFFSISLIGGKIFYTIVQYKINPDPSLLFISSNFLPWQASHQQSIAQLFAEPEDYQRTRYYNLIAIRLEPYEANYLTYQGFLEDGQGNYLQAKSAFLSAIRVNPYENIQYLSLYRTYLLIAKNYLEKENLRAAYNNLAYSRDIFPKLSERANSSAYLNPVYINLKNGNNKYKKNDLKRLNEYIELALNKAINNKFEFSEIKYAYEVLNQSIDKSQ